MPEPKTETWLHIAEGFSRKWQFSNCIGAVDGKHIQIKSPPNSGSMYFNYKGTYSVVLLAVVDSDYKFMIVDVGAYGKYALRVCGRRSLPTPHRLPTAIPCTRARGREAHLQLPIEQSKEVCRERFRDSGDQMENLGADHGRRAKTS
ncbi:hypothetical protein MRX96_035798 [Rhipicephalus microplus]